MIVANKAFKGAYPKTVYADITLNNGAVLYLGPSDFTLGSMSIKDDTTNGKFNIGNANGKTVTLSIANHNDKFSEYDFYKAIINLYVAVELEDKKILKERKGIYYVIDPATPGDVINISGVDGMVRFDKPYKADTIFPATLQKILSDCCIDCGVQIGFTHFDNYNLVVTNKPTDCTYRQVVSWVAQLAGCNARINNNGYLELVWYDKELIQNITDGGKLNTANYSETYDGGDFSVYADEILRDGGNFTDLAPENITKIKSLSVSTDDVIITGVIVKNGEVEELCGEDSYCVMVDNNELALGLEREIADFLGAKLNGLTFRPLSCEIANNPLIEPFDICYVYDRKGNYYLTLINSVNYKINGFTQIACKAEDPIKNSSIYTNKAAEAVVKARREVEQQLSSYDKSVQNMNMLAANAMGLYREEEKQSDGSVIYYQSNKPIYKNESGKCEFVIMSVVYKMTADGFFVSTDGGLSYTSGFDAQGNAVVNVLSAIGITFDWAKGGTLTLGGANNVNGYLNVLDKYGDVIGSWDNTGIKNGYYGTWDNTGLRIGDITARNSTSIGFGSVVMSKGDSLFQPSIVLLCEEIDVPLSGINIGQSIGYREAQLKYSVALTGFFSSSVFDTLVFPSRIYLEHNMTFTPHADGDGASYSIKIIPVIKAYEYDNNEKTFNEISSDIEGYVKVFVTVYLVN